MSEANLPGLGDLLALFGGSNPLAAVGKTFDQFKRGVSDFLTAVENFNATMQTMNVVATRVNAMLDDVEGMIEQISGPLEKVAPGISRLADTLASPVFATIPTDLGDFLDTLGDVARRLQPLAQMADNAGSLFGLRIGRPQAPPAPPVPTKPPAKKAPAKRAPAAKKPAPKQR
jgi:ABC-type transporter Mla subunit MlaD